MCVICSQFRPIDQNCFYEEFLAPPVQAIVDEVDDSDGEISVGDTYRGTLSSITDVDTVSIDLVAGQAYVFSVTGQGNLYDTQLSLNFADDQVAFNDDGNGYFSTISFTASDTGSYDLIISAYERDWRGTGNYGAYELTAIAEEEAGAGSVEDMSRYLTHGFWQENGQQNRAFSTASDNEITVNITDLTARERELAIAAFQAWEMVADLSFRYTTGSANITIKNDEDGDSSSYNAYAYSSVSGQRIQSSNIVISESWVSAYGDEMGSYGYQTYIHEIGHALGLGHQSNYNGSASYGADADFVNDSWQMSVMSYFSQSTNTFVDASFAYVVSPMMADIHAIQTLYGTPSANSETAGDTVWGANSNLGEYWGLILEDWASGTSSNTAGRPMTFVIYDVSGTDVLDFSFSTSDDRIDLRAGEMSDVAGLTGNVGIAVGAEIENLIAGSGDDVITGNALANRVYGGSGGDTIRGYNGNDVIHGQSGIDTIYGGEGRDRLFGGNENDTLDGGVGDDIIYGGRGDDHISGGAGWDTIYSGAGEDLVMGGDGRDVVYLGKHDDVFKDNRQSGTNGADTVYGEAGWDVIQFLGGDDFGSGGNGNDRIRGGEGNDTLKGDAGNDQLFGDKGADKIVGGKGGDTLSGGADADTFVFNAKDGFDLITDFEVDLDVITFNSGANSVSDLAFADEATALLISYEGGGIRLDGLDTNDAIDLTFVFL